MRQRWSVLAVMTLGLQWVGCGSSSQDDVSSSAAPPELGTGGSDSRGDDCTLCSIYQYCTGDDLIEQLNNDTYCDGVVTHCEHGCLTHPWGMSASARGNGTQGVLLHC
ncbi:MAG: hypothetical protein H6717_17425 [Polyangiaceae bacterium]|nr:hypothetical protein [Polyangiaceae bacterium]